MAVCLLFTYGFSNPKFNYWSQKAFCAFWNRLVRVLCLIDFFREPCEVDVTAPKHYLWHCFQNGCTAPFLTNCAALQITI